MSLLSDTFALINGAGNCFVFTMGGDSTKNRGFGASGEMIAFFYACKSAAPCRGLLGGVNAAAAGTHYLLAGKRNSNTVVGVTTAPAPAACLGGVVLPAGWSGFQHCLLPTSADTVNSSAWMWFANGQFINSQGRVVISMFARDIVGATLATTGYKPNIYTGSTIDIGTGIGGAARQAAGSVRSTGAGPDGTLRRFDMESEAIAATGGSGVGLTFAIGEGTICMGGPGVFLYVALTAKDTRKGWYASSHISQGGKSLHSYIRDHLNTTNMANSVETYMRCMLLLNDTTYASSDGGCQGDVTPGGLGGGGLPVGCGWVDAFGHNDVGTDADVSSFLPSTFPAWSYETTTTISSVNVGAGTVDLVDASGMDASGFFYVSDGEIITYTAKVGNQLTGCVFAAYGTTAGPRFGTVYQGYKSYTPIGHAANHNAWDQWLRARWAAAGGVASLFRHFWKVPNPSSVTLEVVVGMAAANLPQREQRHREMVAAVRAHMPSPYFEIVDPRDVCTAVDMVRNRWCDSNATGVTLAAAGVTSVAGDTINCNAGLSSNGIGNIGAETFIWTGKSGNNPTGCTRGAFGTTAYDTGTPSHTSGREVAEHDMVHSSTHGYQEIWRLLFQFAGVGMPNPLFGLEEL